MNDIVKRLRNSVQWYQSHCELTMEAADRLDELEAEIKRLEEENGQLLFAQQWIAEQGRKITELEDKIDRLGVKHPSELDQQ